MDRIYFERQEGMLCAQHAINALVQEHRWEATDLAEIGRALDAAEAAVGAVGPRSASHNYDDSGFFSIQVIQKALEVFQLGLAPWSREDQSSVRADPTTATAFVLNFNLHWFTLRKIGGRQWFNLNSMLPGPELISDTYLQLFLEQMERERYSVYAVVGELRSCPADAHIAANPVQIRKQTEESGPMGHRWGCGSRLGGPSQIQPVSAEDAEFQAALALSRAEADAGEPSLAQAQEDSIADQERRMLEEALRASLETSTADPDTTASTSATASTASTGVSAPSAPAGQSQELRSLRSAFLDRLEQNK